MNNIEQAIKILSSQLVLTLEPYLDKDGIFVGGTVVAEEDMKMMEAYEVAIVALANQQWIPISESLPEIEDLYLVQTDSKYGGSDGKGAMDIDKFSIGEDGSGYWNYWPNSHSGKTQVIAWMPLPEPYKE